MRRIHVKELPEGGGLLRLEAGAAHHVRDVLRLGRGEAVEVFDDGGRVGEGVLEECGPRGVVVRVGTVSPAAPPEMELTVAAAVPKGNRADWMIEKLSELGVSVFVPLRTQRSVVLPEGTGKRQRWERLAAEAARQSRRRGVMRIEELSDLADVMARLCGEAWYLSPQPDAVPAASAVETVRGGRLTVLIGPEGGWTAQEVEAMEAAGLTAVRLTGTILRVETAAIAAAATVASLVSRGGQKERS